MTKQTDVEALTGQNPRRIPIITYHSIDDSGSIVSTSPARFRRQMEQLSAAGYRTVTVGQLASSIQAGVWPAGKTVVLTFDDGFENFLTNAAAVLRQHSFTATVFLVTGQCGRFNDWTGNPAKLPRSRLLSWSQVKELAASGIEFGSHTITHPDLTTLDPEAIDIEISRSKIAIEDAIGYEATSFAYPFGRITEMVQRSVARSYSSACSTHLGKVGGRSDIYRLERIDAYYLSSPASLDNLETHWMDAYLGIRHTLRRVKGAVVRA